MTSIRKNRRRFPFQALALLGTAAYALFLRRRLLHWGTIGDETSQPLPGDDLVSEPNYQTTRAITIQKAPQSVWPWIVQLGYGRGGFYSYDWLERQAGLMGLQSADQINPEWQQLQVGDTIPISPVTPMQVAILEPDRALVLHMVMNPFTAQPVDKLEKPDGPYMDWSWAFVLEPFGENATRLLIRVRADFQPQPLGELLSFIALEPAHFIMENKMLQGIQQRVQTA